VDALWHSLNRKRGHGFRWLVGNKHPEVTRCANNYGHVSECAARDLTDMVMAVAVGWSRPSLAASSCNLLCETLGCTMKEFFAQGAWEEWAQNCVRFVRPAPEKLTFSMVHAPAPFWVKECTRKIKMHLWGTPGSEPLSPEPQLFQAPNRAVQG
jgi:hypothetical protein